MKKLISLVVLVIAALVSASSTSAQETISAEKRALIKDLLEVTNATASADQVFNSVLSMQEAQSAKTMESLINDDKIFSPEEKKEMLQKAQASSGRMIKRFREYFTTELNLGAAVEEITYTLYDKYYTEDELKDLVTFFKSPTGRKSVTVMPKLTADSMSLFLEKLMPKIVDFTKKILDEELVQLKKETQQSTPKRQK